MPSPVGHMLGGVIGGWLVAGAPGWPRSNSVAERRVWMTTFAFAFLGAVADADFLFGTHSTYSHSVGAIAIAGLVALATARRDRLRWALAAAAAYGTHVLFDWMGNDTTPPIGIMALWPFTTDFYQSKLYVFMAISRRYWLANFWTHNLTAVAREVAILAPLLMLTWWGRGPAARAPRTRAANVTGVSLGRR